MVANAAGVPVAPRGRHLTVPQVAALLSCSPQQVRSWLRSGKLAGVRVGDRGHWRVPEAALEGLTSGRREPGPYAPRAPGLSAEAAEAVAWARREFGL